MNQRMVVIVRPAVDEERLAELESAARAMRARGVAVELSGTQQPGDGVRQARQAADAGVAVVVAAGGDGTVNEVVNGLCAADRRARLGVVPLGTANDLAMGLELSTSIAEALSVAERGRPRPVDVARMNERWFLNVSTGGFGAEATEQAAEDSKRLLGPLAYLMTGAKQIAELHPVEARLESAGRVLHDGGLLLFAVGNGKRTGGGSMLTPRAELDDGLLDVLIVRSIPRVDFLALLPDLRAGTHLESPDIAYARVASLDVTTTRPITVNVDGEPTRGTRFRYTLAARALEVMT